MIQGRGEPGFWHSLPVLEGRWLWFWVLTAASQRAWGCCRILFAARWWACCLLPADWSFQHLPSPGETLRAPHLLPLSGERVYAAGLTETSAAATARILHRACERPRKRNCHLVSWRGRHEALERLWAPVREPLRPGGVTAAPLPRLSHQRSQPVVIIATQKGEIASRVGKVCAFVVVVLWHL